MSVYTVFEPPRRTVDDSAEPERFIFVRDGFAVWAFLLTPLWMLRHRLWLVLISYVAILFVLDTAMAVAGVSGAVVTVIGILISLLIGFEASTLRRFTLRRRGWRNVGVVSGDDREDAEQRFFDAWTRETSARQAASPVAAPVPVPRPPQATPPGASGVIGLFPEPGVQR
jgi:hypothetical protein